MLSDRQLHQVCVRASVGSEFADRRHPMLDGKDRTVNLEQPDKKDAEQEECGLLWKTRAEVLISSSVIRLNGESAMRVY
jgi:hypothetical protein